MLFNWISDKFELINEIIQSQQEKIQKIKGKNSMFGLSQNYGYNILPWKTINDTPQNCKHKFTCKLVQ